MLRLGGSRAIFEGGYSQSKRRHPVIASDVATATTAQPVLASIASKTYSIARRIRCLTNPVAATRGPMVGPGRRQAAVQRVWGTIVA
jgi:hypothetical protein